ncbi:unnamed protein product [Prunus armeniaca]|uniref:Uncharacterized protein n=1 Tax=Prunus armeniaca TaxID=36596 RepID=A0A6J5U7D9_PRUAR|nr:unnamed protein product [Prunus armeniaca]CAB4300717.1 unnamed protein product [Prunus armeniaca]
MEATQLLLSLIVLSVLSLSSALPTQTLVNAAEILSDFGYTSMALTLDLASQTSSSPNLFLSPSSPSPTPPSLTSVSHR